MGVTICRVEKGAKLLYEPMPGKVKGSVIICAGGGYSWLSPREEWPVARAFAHGGYQAYILEYKVGKKNAPLGITPMVQLAWAVKCARRLKPGLVAVCGFSAGGHVCSMLGVHWNDRKIIPVSQQEESRPDGLILGYPVTGLEGLLDEEIRSILCKGKDDCEYMETSHYVSKNTPPVFLWHTACDEIVPAGMTLNFAGRLLDHKVPVELHLYPTGVHGLSLATPEVEEPDKKRYANRQVASWFPAALRWLERLQVKKEKGLWKK